MLSGFNPGGIEPGWLWMIGGVVLLIAEIIAPGFFLVFVGAAALATGLFALLFGLGTAAQLALFVLYALLAVLVGIALIGLGALAIGAYVRQVITVDLSMLFWALFLPIIGGQLIVAGAGFVFLGFRARKPGLASRLVGPAWRIPGWKFGAWRKQKSSSRREAAASSIDCSAVTPNAAMTSELPDAEVTARFPCLATGTPAAATTRAAAVEMLKVECTSPPVPQVSTVPSGAGTASTRFRIARTKPVSSSTVSPRIRMPTSSAASWAGVTSPSSTEPMVVSASSADRYSPTMTAAIAARMASVTWTTPEMMRPTSSQSGRKAGPSAVPPAFGRRLPVPIAAAALIVRSGPLDRQASACPEFTAAIV